MRFSILRRLHVAIRDRRRVDPAVSQDADDLMQIWGADAFDRAAELSWREASGVVRSSEPGRWQSVRREVGWRLGERAG